MLIFRTEEANCFNTQSLREIINDRITGVVVHNAFPEELRQKVINTIDKLKGSYFTDLNYSNGFSLPIMFGQLYEGGPVEDFNLYYQQIPDFIKKVNQELGFDFSAFVQQQLKHYFGHSNVEPLQEHLPFSFRVLYSNKGGLFVHKDSALLSYVKQPVADKIRPHIRSETMMSWFFTLQCPKEGGELWVAHSRYANYEKEGQFHLKDPVGNKLNLDELEHIKITTPACSLLMFNGGNHWHKVIPPSDTSCNRITLGGFMALSTDGEKIYYWS
jgi:hypothetical protein